MWESNDKQNYQLCNLQNIVQICNDEFSKEIEYYSLDLTNKTFLEIGTWNGLGSTKVFADSLFNRSDDYIFYSLECNTDKSLQAAKLYKYNDKLNILNEVIWNEEPDNFYQIFPQCKTDARYKLWNDVDIINMKKCNLFLNRQDLPDIFDVILLDGGEFTTYFEFQLLKDRCKILLLDDILADKCILIVNEIEQSPDKWRIIKKNTSLRNGFMIAEKI
jgi:hypothetical protein